PTPPAAPARGTSPQSTPWSVSRASSPPERTRTGWPVADPSAAAKAAPLAASRTALVPTISTRPAPRRAARSEYSVTVSAVRVMAASERRLDAASPSPSRGHDVPPPGDHDHGRGRAHLLDGAGDVESGALRHREVGDHNVERPPLEAREALEAVRRALDGVAGRGQRVEEHAAQVLLVLDHEDGAGLGGTGRGRGRQAPDRCRRPRLRQAERERRPVSGLALHLDPAVVAADDAVDDREAEAGPLRRAGREERIEDAALDLRRHPLPRVAPHQLDRLP